MVVHISGGGGYRLGENLKRAANYAKKNFIGEWVEKGAEFEKKKRLSIREDFGGGITSRGGALFYGKILRGNVDLHTPNEQENCAIGNKNFLGTKKHLSRSPRCRRPSCC